MVVAQRMPPDGVEREELPVAHVAQAGEPGGDDAKPGDEAGDNHRLRAVFLEERLAPREQLGQRVPRERDLADRRAAAEAGDPVARVVSDNGRESRDGDHLDDVEVPTRGKDGRRDQRRFAGKRNAAPLDGDEREQKDQAVGLELVGHPASLGMSTPRSGSSVSGRVARAMRVGVPKETAKGEQRVALVPDAVGRLEGFTVAVEKGAGEAAGFIDAAYADAGAELVSDAWEGADAIVKVAGPDESELGRLKSGQVLVAFLQPLTETERIEKLRSAGVFAFAMESIPRTTRAQSMDALSSQATVAGYKAVLIGADTLPRFLPMLTTAAGTIAPARALVLGAGVAGLQAIATARRLGALVSGFDVRPAVREQVQSLGATFLDLGVVGEETEGGYARELTPEEQARQQEALEQRIPDFDLVITTAAIPGRPAPKLIPAAAVEKMRPGSVIVDLAAETGGNCELTRPGEIVDAGGVTVVGLLNLPSEMPGHASQLYARNVSALLAHLAPGGVLALDWDDEITAGACVTRPESA